MLNTRFCMTTVLYSSSYSIYYVLRNTGGHTTMEQVFTVAWVEVVEYYACQNATPV